MNLNKFKFLALAFYLLISLNLFSQHPNKRWYFLYSEKDTMYGIALDDAIKSVPKPENAKPVIVAVIDGGTDPKHEDLMQNMWVNEKEIANNGVDDDNNGYVDDIYGWNFIGGKEKNVEHDNLERTRLIRKYKEQFDNLDLKKLNAQQKKEYKEYQSLLKINEKELAKYNNYYKFYTIYRKYTQSLVKEMGSDTFTLKELETAKISNSEAKVGQSLILNSMKTSNKPSYEVIDEIYEGFNQIKSMVEYHLNVDYDSRNVVGDDYGNSKDNNYGNPDVKGEDALHGTHVAGIIGALSNNNLGNDGIAPLVKLMIIRAVPNGDERDKDVANAIRYAVDNGAKVINMSFGKAYKWDKAIVDDAVRYAESKDVLLIHAAGNDGKNTDKEPNFPSPRYANGQVCRTWIEVGASQMNQGPADFSNYGPKTVNVFAPGFEIYNTAPDNQYKWLQGTSMAAPVVAGLAALIRSYYPHLTALQVKEIIESTVEKPTKKFKKPGKKRKKTKYKKLCTSAGVINAKNALIKASQTK